LQKARYIQFFGGKTHPRKLDAKHIEKFLSHLATKGNVAASTQLRMTSGTHALMAKLLYGAGLRLMEYAFGGRPGLSGLLSITLPKGFGNCK
jgi:hypothetical protein